MFLTVVCNSLQKLKIDVLYLRYRKLMYSKAYEILADKNMAEDAVAETVEIMIKNKNKIEGKEEEYVRNYMLRICRNVAIKMKKNPGFPYENMEDLQDIGARNINPEDIVIDNEGYLMLKKEISRLKPEYKDIIMLRYVNDMDIKEISEITGLTADTVRKRLQRAKNALAELLRKEKVSDE